MRGSYNGRARCGMRILFFSPRDFGPRNTGAHLRDYYLARELARQDKVSFVGFRDPLACPSPTPSFGNDQEPEFERTVRLERGPGYTAGRVLRGFIGPMPVTVLNYYQAAAARSLAQMLEEHPPDLVQLEQIHLAAYLPALRSTRKRTAVVCDWHNIESELMRRYGIHSESWSRRLYAQRTTVLIERLERRMLSECDAHLVVSERERDRLLQLCPQAQVHVVQNGVDVRQFASENASNSGASSAPRRNIVFVGSMDFHANIDAVEYFTREVWPTVRASLPELRFMIVGSNPALSVRELANVPGIVVTGTVEDVRPYYRDALAAVVPIRVGGGTRLKILEAMAAGVPVISTTIGAEGLVLNPGTDILLADTPEHMARAVQELARSPQMRCQLAAAGRQTVQDRYDWSAIGSGLRLILRSLCNHEN